MRCGEILPLDPFGEAELLPVDRELIRAIKLGEEANEEGIRERPGLVRDVGEIAHGKAYLLLDFAPAALLQGLAYLGISCDERMVCGTSTCILRKEQALAVHDHDDRTEY